MRLTDINTPHWHEMTENMKELFLSAIRSKRTPALTEKKKTVKQAVKSAVTKDEKSILDKLGLSILDLRNVLD
jgi:hypothetical protein